MLRTGFLVDKYLRSSREKSWSNHLTVYTQIMLIISTLRLILDIDPIMITLFICYTSDQIEYWNS